MKSYQINSTGSNQPVSQRTMQFILHFMKFYSRRPARVLLLTSWNQLVCKHTTGLSLSFHRPNESPHIVFLFSFALVYTETGKCPVYLHKENEVSATARNDIVFNIFSYSGIYFAPSPNYFSVSRRSALPFTQRALSYEPSYHLYTTTRG